MSVHRRRLEVESGRLLDASGSIPDATALIKDCMVQDSGSLTAQINHSCRWICRDVGYVCLWW